ncbi:hypothetical protein Trydic_g6744 [Trypoxylus dichotomus]
MAHFRILFACVCILTLLDLGLASILLLKSNVRDEIAERARIIVAGAYANYHNLGLKVKYVARRMKETYGRCTWNVVPNPGPYQLTADYWIVISGRQNLFYWTDFLIFSTRCNGQY